MHVCLSYCSWDSCHGVNSFASHSSSCLSPKSKSNDGNVKLKYFVGLFATLGMLLRLFDYKTYFKDVTTQLSMLTFCSGFIFSLDLNLLLSENSTLLVVFYSAIAVRQGKVIQVFVLALRTSQNISWNLRETQGGGNIFAFCVLEGRVE